MHTTTHRPINDTHRTLQFILLIMLHIGLRDCVICSYFCCIWLRN